MKIRGLRVAAATARGKKEVGIENALQRLGGTRAYAFYIEDQTTDLEAAQTGQTSRNSMTAHPAG